MRGITDSHRAPDDFQSVDSNPLASDLEGGSCGVMFRLAWRNGTQRVEWQQRRGANRDVLVGAQEQNPTEASIATRDTVMRGDAEGMTERSPRTRRDS